MDLKLTDKVFVVSGGAKGIGAGIMQRLAAEGAVAIAVERSTDAGMALVEAIRQAGGKADFHALKMTDEDSVRQTVASISKTHGRIDGVINNAGRNDAITLRHSVREFEESLRNNLVQIFTLTHYCLDPLIESKGVIINIGS